MATFLLTITMTANRLIVAVQIQLMEMVMACREVLLAMPTSFSWTISSWILITWAILIWWRALVQIACRILALATRRQAMLRCSRPTRSMMRIRPFSALISGFMVVPIASKLNPLNSWREHSDSCFLMLFESFFQELSSTSRQRGASLTWTAISNSLSCFSHSS